MGYWCLRNICFIDWNTELELTPEKGSKEKHTEGEEQEPGFTGPGGEGTCPSGQAAAVARDRIAAVRVAAVTALTAVEPECAILWRGRERKTIRMPQRFPHTRCKN